MNFCMGSIVLFVSWSLSYFAKNAIFDIEQRNQKIGATIVLTLLEKGEYVLENGTKISLKGGPFFDRPDPITYVFINLDEKEKGLYEKLNDDPFMQELVLELES